MRSHMPPVTVSVSRGDLWKCVWNVQWNVLIMLTFLSFAALSHWIILNHPTWQQRSHMKSKATQNQYCGEPQAVKSTTSLAGWWYVATATWRVACIVYLQPPGRKGRSWSIADNATGSHCQGFKEMQIAHGECNYCNWYILTRKFMFERRCGSWDGSEDMVFSGKRASISIDIDSEVCRAILWLRRVNVRCRA